MPGPVQIREMPPPEEDPLDETEVRTVVGTPSEEPKKVAAPAAADEFDEELEDSVTTQAPAAVKGGRLPEEDEPKTSPPLRMPPPIPAAGRSPFDQPPIPSPAPPDSEDDPDAYNAEESVTTRGPAIPDFKLPDEGSVTANSHAILEHAPESSGRWPSPITPNKLPATMSQALGLPPAGMPPPIEDGTEGTTNRPFTNKKPAPRPNVTQPSALQQLPVIGPAAEPDDEEELDNRTAVMIGAPVKPERGPPPAARLARAGGMSTQASPVHAQEIRADQSSSESGLRIAPHDQPPAPQPASLGAMMAGALAANDRSSGAQPLPSHSPHGSVPYFPNSEPMLALGATLPANSPQLQSASLGPGQSPMQQYDFAATIKKPRYGLLVGLVALLSFAIPLVLFLWLHQSVQEPLFRSPSEVASDHVGFAPPQGKALASASASGAHKKPPPGRH
jgi:hypothetical protein